ncbi:MAG: plastocyanin/azurin family copper-binding protein [Patescibacteria group bacterium]
MKIQTVGIIIVLILLGVLAIMFFQKQPVQQMVTEPFPSPMVSVEPTPVVMTFSVEGTPYSFTPDEIKVKRGDLVRIEFTSVNGLHDWVIDEYNARTAQLNTGQSETIEFIADKTGTFEYYCSVGNHRQMGMVGNLIVE